MRRANDRAILSKSKPEALWRLARWAGITNPECHCIPCMVALVEALARELERY
jgi:hypothetical protein